MKRTRMQNSIEMAVIHCICSEYWEVMRDRNKAIEMAEKAIEFNPDYTEANIRLGRFYFLEGNLEKAESYLKYATMKKTTTKTD